MQARASKLFAEKLSDMNLWGPRSIFQRITEFGCTLLRNRLPISFPLHLVGRYLYALVQNVLASEAPALAW